MADSIKLKRSAVAAKVPLTTDLALGEVAINTYDGKMYIKKDNGAESIVQIGSGTVTSVALSGGTTGLTVSGSPITTSGTITISGTLALANGGTGQTSKTAAFDALSPTTTKGDLIVYNGTDNIRVAAGTNDQVLIADSTQASGVKWGSPPASAPSLQTTGVVLLESDFCEASSNSNLGAGQGGTIGPFRWYNGSGGNGFSYVEGVANHPGIIKVNNLSTGGNENFICTGTTSSYLSYLYSDLDRFEAIIRINVGSSFNNGRIGFANSFTNGTPTHAAWFKISGGYLVSETRSAGSTTTNNCVLHGSGSWYHLKIVRNGSGNWEFTVNGTLYFTHTTNLPTTALAAGVLNVDTTNGNTIDVDYMGVLTKSYGNRY